MARTGHSSERGKRMLLAYRQFFVKERVAMVKLTDTYDIFDPISQEQIGIARDEPPGWAKYARLLVNKRFLPTVVNVYEDEESGPIFSLHKQPGFMRVGVVVRDARGNEVGKLRSKVMSLGGAFVVTNPSGAIVAELKGHWVGWDFRLLSATGVELGSVNKKYAGFSREFFTTADNYLITLDPEHCNDSDPRLAALLLAAGLAVDIVFKEQS